MRTSREKEQVYRSMEDFEKKFLPVSFKKRLVESMDLRTLAVSLAEQSLQKIGRELAK